MSNSELLPWGAPYLHCLYAEDIRHEQGGQRTIVGAYPSGVKVAGFPAHLVKLAILADLALPMEQEYKTLALELRLDDELLQHVPVNSNLLTDARNHAQERTASAAQRGYGVQFVLLLNNLTVARSGLLRLVALLDETELRGNGFELEGVEAT
ncbi:MAG: hypothetical protein GXC94_02675 [Comamonadaceae bacterium]|nr:hypothetical protein [Comamonadaceae bacterium]